MFVHAIGAEYREGFETFRPNGLLKVDVDFLNDRLQEGFLRRIRYAMKPDEAYGLIFSWDNVVTKDVVDIDVPIVKLEAIVLLSSFFYLSGSHNTQLFVDNVLPHHTSQAVSRALKLDAWNQLPLKKVRFINIKVRFFLALSNPNSHKSEIRALPKEKNEADQDRLKMRLSQLYHDKLLKISEPIEGLKEWLDAVSTARIPCAVVSSFDRRNMVETLERMGLMKYFQAIVTEEDGMESIAHRFLSAAVKLDRKPSKCVVFEDDSRGITAAHNCTMMAVALIGAHPAYDLVQADLAVGSFSELSVINLRRLFAHKGSNFMDLEKQIAEKAPPIPTCKCPFSVRICRSCSSSPSFIL
ncbi:hypothetical protein MTR67_027055 [Solanum verrucosum]|uniref:Haloacid dehalogenase-like hydrolase superfamily protein n=1 Tax=Solanum verrucosum TaxID=315347 RepID=A0AAF0TZF6_SOLVR|nr:hypothetical protein MTR67_027055 [Solanum verrucosum]